MGISNGTITKTIQFFNELVNYENNYSSGWPRITIASDDRTLIRKVHMNRTISSAGHAATWYLSRGKKASSRTARRRP